MTTALAVWLLSIVVGGVAVIDCLRRPQSEWVTADRARSAWVTWIVLGAIFCLGVPMGVVYLVAVVPRFGRRTVPIEFEKANVNR